MGTLLKYPTGLPADASSFSGQVYGFPAYNAVDSGESANLYSGLSEDFSGNKLVLDNQTDCIGAWSLRKLRTAYTGNCIRIRRTTDDTEQDIGFDSNGVVDTSAISTFASGGAAHIRTWYDQSGAGNDAGQATPAMQPIIYQSGSIQEDDNGNPTLNFRTIDMHMRIFGDSANDQISVFCVGKKLNLSGENFEQFFTKAPDAFNDGFGLGSLDAADTNFGFWVKSYTGNVVSYAQSNVNNYALMTGIYDQVNVQAWVDGVSQGTDAYTGGVETGNETIIIGAFNQSGDGSLKGDISEILYFEAAKTSERSTIESDITTYYSI